MQIIFCSLILRKKITHKSSTLTQMKPNGLEYYFYGSLSKLCVTAMSTIPEGHCY